MARRFIVVDDHPLFRGALTQVLAGSAEIREAAGIDGLIEALGEDEDVDLVLLDLNIPGAHGFSGLLLVRAQFPQVPVLVVSGEDGPDLAVRCLELGAAGFLRKSATAADMRRAVDTVLEGGTWPPDAGTQAGGAPNPWQRLASLSPQQVRVLMMMSAGQMNKQIAYELGIAEATVKAHVSAILLKLGVDSRTQAVLLASSLERSQFAATDR